MAAIPGSVRVGGFIAPSDSTDTYPSHDAIYGLGGLREVADVPERNAIPNDRRREGMVAFTVATGEYWKLNASPWVGTNADWSILDLSPTTLSGDVSGAPSATQVNGIQSRLIANSPVTGGRLIYDTTTNQLHWYNTLVYASLAAAVAGQADQFIGTDIIVSGTLAENGTYQVTTLTGNTTDYTKISDTTDLASEITVDGAIAPLIPSNTDLYTALQLIVGAIGGAVFTTVNLTGAPSYDIVDAIDVDAYGAADWDVVIENVTTGVREKWRVEASHDGIAAGSDATAASYTVSGLGPDSGAGHDILVDVAGTGVTQTFRLRIMAGAAGWRAVVKRSALDPA